MFGFNVYCLMLWFDCCWFVMLLVAILIWVFWVSVMFASCWVGFVCLALRLACD